MSCQDYEELIYTFRELESEGRTKIMRHIETCGNCKKLMVEVQKFLQTLNNMNQENQPMIPSDHFMNRVINSISDNSKDEIKQRSLLDHSIGRYILAAVSCGILILFFLEILMPDFKSGKIKGPISNIQGAIIKSEDFRKVFTRSKEKKSLFSDCKNVLSQQVDTDCVKEKLNKINF